MESVCSKRWCIERCALTWNKKNQSKTKNSVYSFLLFRWLLFCMLNIFRSHFLSPRPHVNIVECRAFYMQAKFHSVFFTLFSVYALLQLLLLYMLPPLGILLSFFFFNAKVFVCVYVCINQTVWNNFLPSWLAFRLSLGSTKMPVLYNYEKFTIFILKYSVGIFASYTFQWRIKKNGITRISFGIHWRRSNVHVKYDESINSRILTVDIISDIKCTLPNKGSLKNTKAF